MPYGIIKLKLLGGPEEHDGQRVDMPCDEVEMVKDLLPNTLMLSCGHAYMKVGEVKGKGYILFIYAGFDGDTEESPHRL